MFDESCTITVGFLYIVKGLSVAHQIRNHINVCFLKRENDRAMVRLWSLENEIGCTLPRTYDNQMIIK